MKKRLTKLKKFINWWWSTKVANVTYRRWIADFKSVQKYGVYYLTLPREKRRRYRKRKKEVKKYGAGFLGNRQNIKQKLAKRDGPYCRVCLRYNMTSSFVPVKELTIDHIIPVSKGGTNDLDNLQLLCRHHHDLKDNTLPKNLL